MRQNDVAVSFLAFCGIQTIKEKLRLTFYPEIESCLNPLTPGAFCQKGIFWTFWRFSAWILATLAKALATWQLAFLASSIAFYDILALARAEIKVLRFLDKKKVTYIFKILDFFRRFFFFSSFLFAAVIDLLLGLLAVKKTFKKASSRRAIFTMEILLWVFHSTFRSFLCILGLSLLSGYDWKDLFLLQKLSIDDANFGQKWGRQKWKKGQGSSRPVTARTGVNALMKFNIKWREDGLFETKKQTNREFEINYLGKKSRLRDIFLQKNETARRTQPLKKRDCETREIRLKFCETQSFWRTIRHP